MIKEHERVVLKAPLPAAGLEAGDVGTVVHTYRDGKAYEVEFTTLEGKTAAVVTVEKAQVRAVGKREMYFPVSENEPAGTWPSLALPNFLDLQELGPVPEKYRVLPGDAG